MIMPAPTTTYLRDYRDKLGVGTTLGLGYSYYDTAYLATRGTHPTRYTVARITDAGVTFTLDGGHRCDLPWDTVLTYLRFGPAPYPLQENILPAQSD